MKKENGITVVIGQHAYDRLVERLNIKSPATEQIFGTLNSIQPWYLRVSRNLYNEHFLDCPQVAGGFILTFDEADSNYFAKTFESYPRTEGRETTARFLWYKIVQKPNNLESL